MAQFNLTLKDAAGNAVGQYNIETAGAAQHIQAVDGVYYQITDLATGIGPESIITDRVGDNLLVSFDRDQSADLVIENYFSQGQPGALVGLQENGGLFNYPVATMPEHVLAEEIAAADTLNADTSSTVTPLAILGGVALVAGLWFIGREVIATVGTHLAEMSPAAGFTAELAAAMVVMLASSLGLPVSSTHILVGAILGIGLVNRNANWRLMKPIALAWLITVPAAGVCAAIAFFCFNSFF